MKKKVKSILLIFFIILCTFSNVYAKDIESRLDIIEKSSETKYLENDQGYISKTILDSNAETGEATIELKLFNTKKETEKEEKYENTEIYIMISENTANSEEKMEKWTNNIQNLASKIIKANSKVKIGIIGITGTISDSEVDENGKKIWGEKDEGDVPGKETNAEIVAELTNDVEEIIESIKNMNQSKTKYYTNLQAAIRLANKSYSDNVNKVLISLYDSVPWISIGVKSKVTYGGLFSEYSTPEEAVKGKHEKIARYTKSEILSLKDSNVSFILLRPDDTSYDETWYNITTGEKLLEFDGSPYVKEIYGTKENPTSGKMHEFTDENIDTVIGENIYQDIKELIQQNMYSIKIVDYFPKDITDNFEFSYVGEPSVGTASDSIDLENKTITWDIDTLKGDEVSTLKYKLKLKDMKNQALLNKTISTNEKVVLTYKDAEDKDYTVTLSSSPKIRLTEIKEKLTAAVSYNPSTDTSGTVTATIKTNKMVNPVNGWTLSTDGMTLTKTYSINTTEIVNLVDIDNMTKDVNVVVNNIKINNNNDKYEDNNNKKDEDETIAKDILPRAGIANWIIASLIAIASIVIFTFIKTKKYKDIE